MSCDKSQEYISQFKIQDNIMDNQIVAKKKKRKSNRGKRPKKRNGRGRERWAINGFDLIEIRTRW